MREYITKERALEAFVRAMDFTDFEWDRVCEEMDFIPPADVVEVVRCKDCKYRSMESGEFDGLEPACRFWTDAAHEWPGVNE